MAPPCAPHICIMPIATSELHKICLTALCSTLEEEFLKLLRVDPLTCFNLCGGVGVYKAPIPKGADLFVCLVIGLEETFPEYVSLRIFCHNPPTVIHGHNNLHTVLPFVWADPWPGASTCLRRFACVAGGDARELHQARCRSIVWGTLMRNPGCLAG